MSKKPNDINDDEIRIISVYKPEMRNAKRRSLRLYVLIVIGILLLGTGMFLFVHYADESESDDNVEFTEIITEEVPEPPIEEKIEEKHVDVKGFTIALDTTVNRTGLLILSPENARPRLVIGTDMLNDSNIILATQAADVRRDNGQIVGSFVMDGELISKGEAKAGYCSIVNGDLSIGVADATPMLEQTLTEGGYFFRQYPLVVGGQIVENKPKGRAVRKALAEIGGKICVVVSKKRLSFHDFSQLLIDAGARNAIYLVGSSSYGFYVNDKDEKIVIGKSPLEEIDNVSYIIWERL